MVILEPPQQILGLLRDALVPAAGGGGGVDPCGGGGDDDGDDAAEILAYVATLASSLASAQNFDPSEWVAHLGPYLAALPSQSAPDAVEGTVAKFCRAAVATLQDDDALSDGALASSS